MVVRYCNIDYDREIAIVAELVKSDQRKILGVARVSIESDGKNGEVAFIVRDQYQGLGLGTKLVDYVLDIAKEKRLEEIYAIVLQDNARAMDLMKKMGFNFEYVGEETVRGTLNLKNEDSETPCLVRATGSGKKETAAPTAHAELAGNKKKTKALAP